MKNTKATILSLALMIVSLTPQIAIAHSSSSFMAQMAHTISHAHHAFGGLLIIAVLFSVLKIRQKLVAKRIQKKR